jgi:hypothetical protein
MVDSASSRCAAEQWWVLYTWSRFPWDRVV